MRLHLGHPLLSLPSRRRGPLLWLVTIFGTLSLLYYHLFQRFDTRPGSNRSRLIYQASRLNQQASPSFADLNSNLTVNLVLASRRTDDITWTHHLRDAIPNLNVIRYISDFNPDEELPEYHPPVPKKGREATIYHSYFHDFYHDLPDISILAHAEEQPWHIEGVLQQSMLFTLRHLDLHRIAQRGGYANLRVDWADSCPEYIDTSLAPEEATKKEEPYMREAFRANFPDHSLPSKFAGPCCAQFAVTREAIQRNSRISYARSKKWLVDTEIGSQKVGRTWEHMWPWLFLHHAPDVSRERASSDCPAEWNAYCSMYGICFDDSVNGPEAASNYNNKWAEKEALRRDHLEEWWNRLLHPFQAANAAAKIMDLEAELDEELATAMQRGQDPAIRNSAFGELFGGEPKMSAIDRIKA